MTFGKGFMERVFYLYMTSIICGFSMMALEILGARVLQPYFGSGIDVWAAVIAVFILSLSVGYFLGGRLADASLSNKSLGIIITLAAGCYLLLPLWARPFIELLGSDIHEARLGVLFAAIVLFFPPSLLLGSVSPLLVKLVFESGSRVGRTTGTLYAIGSVGNVLGILCTDFVLLPLFEINSAIFVMGLIMGLLGISHGLITLRAVPTEANAQMESR